MTYKEKVRCLLSSINAKEELLLTFWNIRMISSTERLFKEEFMRIEISLIEENKLLDKIITIFSSDNNLYTAIYSLCEEYNLSISSVIHYLDKKSKQYSEYTNEYKILTYIRHKLLLGLKDNKRLEEQELDYAIAKETMTIFLNTDANTSFEFNKITKCSKKIFKMSIEVLREKNHPLYLEYLKRKEDYFNSNVQQFVLNNENDINKENKLMEDYFNHLTSYQLFEIIKNGNSKEYKFLCKKYRIKPTILKELISFYPYVAIRVAFNPMTYFEYEDYLNNLVEDVALKIKDVMDGKKNNFDLFKYYSDTGISLYKLYEISNYLGNSDNRYIICIFYRRHKYSFSSLTENHLKVLRSTGIISFNDETVKFSRGEFDKALELIDNKNMPRCKELLFEVIKSKLYLKHGITKNNKVFSLEQVNNLEELLMIKWMTRGNKDFHYSYNYFMNKVLTIVYNNAIDNFSGIINDLKIGMSLTDVKKKYLITSSDFKEILKQYLKDSADTDVLSISISNKELSVPKKEDLEFILANVAFNIYFKYECFLTSDIEEKLNCREKELRKYLRIIEVKNKEVYNHFMRERKNEKSKKFSKRSIRIFEQIKENTFNNLDNPNSDDVLNIFNNPKSLEFSYFCQKYNLNARTLVNLLKINPLIRNIFANNIDNINNIYNYYVVEYEGLIKKVINDIVELKESGYREPFDLYEYYSNTDVDIYYLARLALDYQIDNNSIILEYINNHKDLFLGIDEKGMIGLKSVGKITCCGKSVSFDRKQADNALNDINEKKIPHIKGVMYYAIRRQLDNDKVKKNTFLIIKEGY